MADILHEELICRGRCSIGLKPAAFLQEVRTLVRSLQRRVAQQLGLTSELILHFSCIDDPPAAAGHSCDDCDMLWHQAIRHASDGLFIGQLPRPFTKLHAVREIYAHLFSKKLFTALAFDAQTLFLLNFAIILKEGTQFASIIQAISYGEIPKCSLSYLLMQAIRFHLDDAVTALLRHGLSPNCALYADPDFTSLPIIDTCFQISALRPSGGPGNESLRRLNTILRQILARVDRIQLAENGVFEVIFTKYVTSMAVRDFASIEMLVVSASGVYLEQCSSDESDVDKSPLLAILAEIIRTRERSFSSQEVANIIAFGLLPLIRSGMRVSFRSLVRLLLRFNAFARFIPRFETLGREIWDNARSFPDLLVEIIEDKEKIRPVGNAHMPIVQMMHQKLPQKLQMICRTVILRCLPFGLESRYDAVKCLAQPAALIDLLDFVDLEPKSAYPLV